MELIIRNPTEEGFLKAIEFNHEEIVNELLVRLGKYQGLVYNDEQIKLAKSDKATLNKFKEALEIKRKEIKRLCLKPYEEFESKIKEILNLVDRPIDEIDSQIKAFELKQKEGKRAEIKALYKELAGELIDLISLEKLWNSRWLNTTYRLSMIAEEMTKTVDTVRNDLKILDGLNSEYDTEIKAKYLETLSLSDALATKTRLEEQKKKLDSLKEAAPKVVDAAVAEFPSAPMQSDYEIQLEMLEFRVWVTPAQKQALRECILKNKILCKK